MQNRANSQDAQSAGGEGGLPAVTIPEIPAHLVPRFQEMGSAALDGAMVTLGALPSALRIPIEPRNEWLSGSYLADARQFGDVEQYWLAIDSLVAQLRASDVGAFHDAFAAQVEAAEAAGLPADTAAMLLARADSGFLATRASRFEAYAQMEDVVNAALALHQFLVENEASIQYAPATGGVSADPVLEAVPDTPELNDRMWTLVDGITGALDVLGTLDRVTTERLTAVLLERIDSAGFR
jgi:hypothetical protein